MKVLHIPAWFPTRKNPLNGIYIFNFINHLSLYDPNTEHIVLIHQHKIFQFNGRNFIKLIKQLFFPDGIQGTQLPPNLRVGEIGRIIDIPPLIGGNWIKKLERAYINFISQMPVKPDLIHVHVSFPGLVVASAIKNKFDIPFLITEHSSRFPDIRFKKYRYTDRLIKDCFKSASKVCFVSKFLANKFGVKTPYVIIPNFIEKPEITEELTGFKEFTFIVISKMSDEKKRIDLVIKASALLKKSELLFRVIMVGDGKLKDDYMQLGEKLNVTDRLFWTGSLYGKDKWNAITQSDCLIVASDIETFSIVAVESLFCGKPVIATRCGGVEELINDENGVLIEKDNFIQLAGVMEKFVNNAIYFNQNKIKNEASMRYDGSLILEKYLSIYRGIVS